MDGWMDALLLCCPLKGIRNGPAFYIFFILTGH